MQGIIKLIMNSYYGVQIRTDIIELYKCKSEYWMKTEYDNIVLDYWRLPNGKIIVKSKNDDGLDGDNDVKDTLPSHLGAFILSNIKRVLNDFIRKIIDFYNNSVFYGDTDILHIEKKYSDVLDKAGLVADIFCHGKNDYKSRGIFYGLFLARKIKNCVTIDSYNIIQEHKTFKGLNNIERILDRSQYFKMIEGEKISAMLPESWKKAFNNRNVMPAKLRFCNECADKLTCNRCNNQINENKEFEANLNLLKGQASNQFGHMLRYYEENFYCQFLVLVVFYILFFLLFFIYIS